MALLWYYDDRYGAFPSTIVAFRVWQTKHFIQLSTVLHGFAILVKTQPTSVTTRSASFSFRKPQNQTNFVTKSFTTIPNNVGPTYHSFECPAHYANWQSKTPSARSKSFLYLKPLLRSSASSWSWTKAKSQIRNFVRLIAKARLSLPHCVHSRLQPHLCLSSGLTFFSASSSVAWSCKK